MFIYISQVYIIMSSKETFEICNYYDCLPKEFRSKSHGMNEDLGIKNYSEESFSHLLGVAKQIL